MHHRHVDDVDHDPYSAKRGLWFSHMGWMLRNYPSGALDLRNARDLEANPIVMFQHRYYLWIAVGMNCRRRIPARLVARRYVRAACCCRASCVWSSITTCTFFINSLAHCWGGRPYTTQNTARDNGLSRVFTWGEGYHNYHHLFQWDYRNGVRWWQWDPTKWLIASASAIGMAKSLKRVPEFQIRQALVERQFEKTKERLAQCGDQSRFAKLQQSLEHELGHFRETLGAWTSLQQERLADTTHKIMDQLAHNEVMNRVRALEESLVQQHRRVRAIGSQAT